MQIRATGLGSAEENNPKNEIRSQEGRSDTEGMKERRKEERAGEWMRAVRYDDENTCIKIQGRVIAKIGGWHIKYLRACEHFWSDQGIAVTQRYISGVTCHVTSRHGGMS